MYIVNLLETNIYDCQGKLLICGTCLPVMQKEGFDSLVKKFDRVLFLCLEKDHINMAITKICGMLATKKIDSLTFASVNKSPHCTQLHYIKKEIVRVMNSDDLPLIVNLVIQDKQIYKINDEVLSLSKDLVRLSNLVEV